MARNDDTRLRVALERLHGFVQTRRPVTGEMRWVMVGSARPIITAFDQVVNMRHSRRPQRGLASPSQLDSGSQGRQRLSLLCDDRICAMINVVAEIEAHDEVVEWFDELSQTEWERTSVVIDRLASLGSQARMPFSRSLVKDSSKFGSQSGRLLAGPPTGSPKTVASFC